MGADPVAYAIAAASFARNRPIDAFSVRKTAKGHGTRRRIEGNYQPGMQVVIVEDVVTSGASALEAAQAVEAEGGRVVGVLAVVDRQQGGGETIVGRGYPLVSLVTAAELGLSDSS
jgi:orotate phosphoribosyltransferase